MKKIATRLFLTLLIFQAACNEHHIAPIANKIPGNDNGPSHSKHQLPASNSDSGFLQITPGKSAGLFSLTEPADSILALLGKPDFSDAAMGKAWFCWDGRSGANPYQLDVFTIRQMGTADETARVELIRIRDPHFRTSEGLRVGSSLQSVQKAFASLRRFEPEGNPPAARLYYDATAAGIGFFFNNRLSCTAILLHRAGSLPYTLVPPR